jgi:hypothetical protein
VFSGNGHVAKGNDHGETSGSGTRSGIQQILNSSPV